MNSAGIDFYRLVSEEALESWAQVYVRVPFEEEEWSKKGALFGVMRLSGETGLAERGVDVLEELDEYYNKLSGVSDLNHLMEILTTKEKSLVSAWVWVERLNGKRKIKVWANGGAVVKICRGGKWVDLIRVGGAEKVISGLIEDGDKIMLGVGKVKDLEIDEFDDSIEQKLQGGDETWAGLYMEVKSLENEEELVKESDVQEENVSLVVRPTNEVVRKVGNNDKKRKLFFIGVVFLVLLIGSVVVGSIKINNDKQSNRWKEISEPMEKKRSEAEALIGSNRIGARKLAMEVRDEWGKYSVEFEAGKFKDEYRDLGNKIQETWIRVSGEKQVGGDLFLSLGLIRQNMNGTRMAVVADEKAMILDSTIGIVASVGLGDKTTEVVWGKGENKNWIDLAGDEKTTMVLAKDRLYLKIGKNETEKQYDSSIILPVALEVYGGAGYVLDAGARDIWKFVVVDGNLGERRRWLKEGEELKIDKPVDLAIDSDIWVLGEDGQVVRWRRGVREKFSLRGVPEGFGGYRLAVEQEGKKLAVLDRSAKRLVIFDKETGDYVEQIMGDFLGKAEDLVYKKDGRLMVLGEGRLEVY